MQWVLDPATLATSDDPGSLRDLKEQTLFHAPARGRTSVTNHFRILCSISLLRSCLIFSSIYPVPVPRDSRSLSSVRCTPVRLKPLDSGSLSSSIDGASHPSVRCSSSELAPSQAELREDVAETREMLEAIPLARLLGRNRKCHGTQSCSISDRWVVASGTSLALASRQPVWNPPSLRLRYMGRGSDKLVGGVTAVGNKG